MPERRPGGYRRRGPSPQIVTWGKDAVALSAADGGIAITDPRTGQRRYLLRGHSARVVALAFLPDGRRLASIARDDTLRVWDTSSGTPIFAIRRDQMGSFFIAIDPQGRYAVTDSRDGSVVCDLRSRTDMALLTHRDGLGRFSRDGSQFFLAHHLGSVLQCSTAAIDEVCKSGSSLADAHARRDSMAAVDPYLEVVPTGESSAIWGSAASRDGRWIAMCANDSTVKIWDAQTLKRARVLTGHGGQAWCAAFSPDSRLLATGAEHSNGGDIRIWDPETGQQLRHIDGHEAQVTGLAFLPGKRWLASGSLDGKVRLWDYETGQPLGLLHALGEPVRGLAVRRRPLAGGRGPGRLDRPLGP